MLLLTLHLWANHQEVENDEHQDDGQHAHQRILAARLGLSNDKRQGIGEHQVLLWFFEVTLYCSGVWAKLTVLVDVLRPVPCELCAPSVKIADFNGFSHFCHDL